MATILKNKHSKEKIEHKEKKEEMPNIKGIQEGKVNRDLKKTEIRTGTRM